MTMRRTMSGTATGLARAGALLAVAGAVPAVWAVAALLGYLWGSPWAAVPLLPLAFVATLGLARPVCGAVRALVARWTGTELPAGYREPAPVVRMDTGYWWNGHSYARTAKEAREEQEFRLRWTDPANWRDLRFTALAAFAIALPAAVPYAGLAAAGCAVAGLLPPLVGGFGLVAGLAAAPFAWRTAAPVATRLLAAPAAALVSELLDQRADLTVVQAAELRRIERDLHDGAQARLVGLGLSLMTAEKLLETDPERAKALLREARASAAGSLSDLRELVRGIHPPVLSERGLVDAVRALALDSPLQATVTADPQPRLDPPIEAALYFGTAELLANTAKHARAQRVTIEIERGSAAVTVRVTDDGRGGAAPREGGGLAGLRRRLAAFDGSLEIDSPTGGPTVTTMVVPCES
ncbi:sensor histidine kinase [Kitasatospora sp. NPDC006697]|uniref:sensor histidine kinase n=1 Tax=Kitasatospora sp. NPDC006697 TaxID=3364020 RepID=UPI00367F0A63